MTNAAQQVCDCVRRSDGGVSVVGACGCPVHGMKALHYRAGVLLEVLDRDGVMDWHELDDARHGLREALDV